MQKHLWAIIHYCYSGRGDCGLISCDFAVRQQTNANSDTTCCWTWTVHLKLRTKPTQLLQWFCSMTSLSSSRSRHNRKHRNHLLSFLTSSLHALGSLRQTHTQTQTWTLSLMLYLISIYYYTVFCVENNCMHLVTALSIDVRILWWFNANKKKKCAAL